MSQSEHFCKAILEQGANKGKQCDRPKMENGYCGKHQKQLEMDSALKDGKRKCSTYRCLETFAAKTSKKIEYCEKCLKEKEENLKTLDLCKWEEKKCEKQAKESGYCGKHQPRALLLKDAKEKGVRICDDGKRSCKNTTVDNKAHCEECLSKERVADRKRHTERTEDITMCLGCGKQIKELLEGIRGKVQRCAECYEKQRKVEESRERSRNYSEENKSNIDKYMLTYIQSAKTRNLSFELTKEMFEELVGMACYYCGSFNEKEVIGVDRLNSSKNYTSENCVPCCKICNFMKGTLSKKSFLKQAHKIACYNPLEEMSESEDEIQEQVEGIPSSTIPPSKVAELYKNGKINLYIDACIRDNRSPLFIERIKSIRDKKMSYNEFKIFFRASCKSDSKLCISHASIERKRISYKEIYGYFNNKNGKHAIEVYQRVHGVMDGFKEDMEEIEKKWDTITYEQRTSEIHSVMVKYQNKRANGSVKLLE
jgi:hypothetical protein